jgi:hypothetical protein
LHAAEEQCPQRGKNKYVGGARQAGAASGNGRGKLHPASCSQPVRTRPSSDSDDQTADQFYQIFLRFHKSLEEDVKIGLVSKGYQIACFLGKSSERFGIAQIVAAIRWVFP